MAADLDGGVIPPYVVPGFGSYPSAGGGVALLLPTCRRVPQPQLNLTQDDVVRFRPALICLSRGIYADSYWFGWPP